jgi:hypothetical protein
MRPQNLQQPLLTTLFNPFQVNDFRTTAIVRVDGINIFRIIYSFDIAEPKIGTQKAIDPNGDAALIPLYVVSVKEGPEAVRENDEVTREHKPLQKSWIEERKDFEEVKYYK